MKSLCTDLQLVHLVDPFVNQTTTPHPTYFRLHGPAGRRHRFTDKELKWLASVLPATGEAYVMFNNASCVADGKRFEALIPAQSSLPM